MKSLSTAEKAISVLFLLAEYPAGLGVTQVGKKLSLKTSSAHQFLASLRKMEVLEQDPASRVYRIGPQVLRLCRSYFKQIGLSNRCQSILRSLRDQCGETVVLNIRSVNHIIRVAQAEGLRPIRRIVEIGDQQPLYLGSTGRAIMAFLSDQELESVIRHYRTAMDSPANDNANLPRFDEKWKQKLTRVRQQGYAMSFGELHKGVNALSSPFFNSSNRVIGCVTISGPAEQLKRAIMKKQVKPLLRTAQDISLTIGSAMMIQGRKTMEAELQVRIGHEN